MIYQWNAICMLLTHSRWLFRPFVLHSSQSTTIKILYCTHALYALCAVSHGIKSLNVSKHEDDLRKYKQD